MCCPLVFEFSVGIGGFVIGLGQISFFFSLSISYESEKQIQTIPRHRTLNFLLQFDTCSVLQISRFSGFKIRTYIGILLFFVCIQERWSNLGSRLGAVIRLTAT